ncbi:response regulator [Bacillus sp. RG28]|uniref:Response regulator n=1 Tax=Gottfriedia endophytica TaxID=2820819 RepID=A0A940NS96_9BACI|nr:response regulator [Gottfriedia endophytica]MBP0726112.1 response regulator [Gottfriedia endophytica]
MIRIALIDDEEHALDMLEILLLDIGIVNIIGKFTNPFHALDEMDRMDVDAVFLDIEMPGMKGLELARKIRELHKDIQIIFTTAHSDHAVEAFDIQSTDYLLKPISRERLKKAVSRLKERPTSKILRYVYGQCLNRFQIHISGDVHKPVQWRTSKEKELCAFFIHHYGKVIDREVIINELWPELNYEKARAYLYTCISYLRKTFQAHDILAEIKKVGKGYILEIEHFICDVNVFEEKIETVLLNESIDEDTYNQLDLLYRGEYMAEDDYLWSVQKSIELRKKYKHSLQKLYDISKKENSPFALVVLQKLFNISPDSEKYGRELIKLYIQMGNRSEAIKVYFQLEKAIYEELGVSLEDETVKLYETLIIQPTFSRTD